MKQYSNETEMIAAYACDLKLSTFKEELDDLITEATDNNWSYRTFRCRLLERELEQYGENRKYQRIRKAAFPQMKYLHDLVMEDLPANLPEGYS